MYRSRELQWRHWTHVLLADSPQRIFNDRCVQMVFCLFWGVFILSAGLAYSTTIWPTYAEDLLSIEHLDAMKKSFDEPLAGGSFGMVGFYILNNAGIGLRCFAWGILVIPGMFVTLYNAAVLGASFGYMARPDIVQKDNFFEFVTAHGPFELTAIVLGAGAGLRIGVSWMWTQGFNRIDSLRRCAPRIMPIVGASVVLFVLAALIEAFISPSAAPLFIKQTIAVVSTLMLMFYFVILGYPRD